MSYTQYAGSTTTCAPDAACMHFALKLFLDLEFRLAVRPGGHRDLGPPKGGADLLRRARLSDITLTLFFFLICSRLLPSHFLCSPARSWDWDLCFEVRVQLSEVINRIGVKLP